MFASSAAAPLMHHQVPSERTSFPLHRVKSNLTDAVDGLGGDGERSEGRDCSDQLLATVIVIPSGAARLRGSEIIEGNELATADSEFPVGLTRSWGDRYPACRSSKLLFTSNLHNDHVIVGIRYLTRVHFFNSKKVQVRFKSRSVSQCFLGHI